MAYVQVSMILISVMILLIASGYFLVITSRRFVLYLVVIASFAMRGIGSLFMVLHWSGTDELLLISDIGFGLGGFLLIWTGLRNPAGKLLYYQLIAGILIAFIVISSFVPVPSLGRLVHLLSYPLAAITGTILLREEYVHQGEKNVLNMYFIGAIIAVIIDVVQIVSGR
jgi:hypothetical protein